jgi:hypothetical protein
MAGLSGSVIELSNYLEQRISQKSAEYAAVRHYYLLKWFLCCFCIQCGNLNVI